MVSGNPYEISEQSIAVPLSVGSRIVLYEDVDIDADEGVATSITFSDYVEQYCPETGLLSFEDSDVGHAAFHEMLEESDGVEVIQEYDD